MKYIYILLFFIFVTPLFSESTFYVLPMTLDFPSVKLTTTGPVKQEFRKEFTCLGNFSDKLITITPQKTMLGETPFSVLGDLLYIFQNSKDFIEIERLLSPYLTKEGRDFYMQQITLPAFKTTVRKINSYMVYGYFLDKNTCVIFYSMASKEGNSCSRLILVFENNRWYIGDQKLHISNNFRALSAFLSFFPKGIKSDLKITIPPSLENLAILATDLETISFYNKLASFYKLIPFQEILDNRLK